MSLMVSGAGELRPASGRNAAQDLDRQALSALDGLIDLYCSVTAELGYINRSGSIERFSPTNIVDAPQCSSQIASSGLRLPNIGPGAMIVEQMPQGMLGGPSTVYRELLTDREARTGIFIRNGMSLGEFREGAAGTMISGSCLFGSAGLVGICADGSEISLTEPGLQLRVPLASIRTDTCFSLYEIEGLERLAALIREMNRLNPELSRLMFQIPCEEYMLYCLGAKLNGLISADIYDQICTAIENRSASQERFMRTLLPEAIKFEVLRPLAAVHDLIRQGNFADQDSACTAIYDALKEAHPEHREIFKVFKKVKTLSHISLRGYSLGYVMGMHSDPHHAAIAIETFTENKIAEAFKDRDVQKVLRGKGLSLETLYSLESLIPVNGKAMVVKHVPVPASLGTVGAPLPTVLIETEVPKIGPLFFSGLQATDALMSLVSARYSHVGREV